MSDDKTGQVSENAGKIYEEFYLPALFDEWSPRVVEAAQLVNGQRVIDVACGTGALTLVVSDQIGPEGSVVGVDVNYQPLKWLASGFCVPASTRKRGLI